MKIGFGPDSSLLLIALVYANPAISKEAGSIENKPASSLVTGIMVGTSLGYMFASDWNLTYPASSESLGPATDRSTFIPIIGLGLLGTGAYYFTRNLLSPKWEKRVYNLSYLYLFGLATCITGVSLANHFGDEPRERRYHEKTGTYSPVFPIYTVTFFIPSAGIGMFLGNVFGHKIWL